MMAEEDPIGLARVRRRRRRSQVEPITDKKQNDQRESVERGNRERVQSASSSGADNSSASGRSFSSVTGLMTEDYNLHPFRHTRTSVNKEVFWASVHHFISSPV